LGKVKTNAVHKLVEDQNLRLGNTFKFLQNPNIVISTSFAIKTKKQSTNSEND
jgi:hypothetical protein